MEEVISNEYSQVQAMTQILKQPLLPLQLPDEPTSNKIGHGTLSFEKLNFDTLIQMRREHQTKQASQGVRTKLSNPVNKDKSTHLRNEILREMHSALKEAQDESAVGTGLERQQRWRAPAPGGRGGLVEGVAAPNPAAGSSANAAVSADAVAKTVSLSYLVQILQFNILSTFLSSIGCCSSKTNIYQSSGPSTGRGHYWTNKHATPAADYGLGLCSNEYWCHGWSRCASFSLFRVP